MAAKTQSGDGLGRELEVHLVELAREAEDLEMPLPVRLCRLRGGAAAGAGARPSRGRDCLRSRPVLEAGTAGRREAAMRLPAVCADPGGLLPWPGT